ncbi:hypothetical protein LY632_03505 [Erythrobacter sp. SDW2]|nr:hypothetical protein [Erythrobacter sp. SDW2]UIP07477.1 hypothetical protein LY632_03505 [Erythrobacter sp. SDW2]
MIDMFALLLVHGLLFLAAFRLMMDDSVDHDPVFDPPPGESPGSSPGE